MTVVLDDGVRNRPDSQGSGVRFSSAEFPSEPAKCSTFGERHRAGAKRRVFRATHGLRWS
jgi:hypothetical protein